MSMQVRAPRIPGVVGAGMAPNDADAKSVTSNLSASLSKHVKPEQRQKAIDAALRLLRSRAGSGLSPEVARDLYIELGKAVEKNVPVGQELFPTKEKAQRLAVELTKDGTAVQAAAVKETIKYLKSGPINWGAGVNRQGKPALDKVSVDCLLVRLGEAEASLKYEETRQLIIQTRVT